VSTQYFILIKSVSRLFGCMSLGNSSCIIGRVYLVVWYVPVGIRLGRKEKKRKTTQAAKHSQHQLRKRRHIGPKCRESPPPKGGVVAGSFCIYLCPISWMWCLISSDKHKTKLSNVNHLPDHPIFVTAAHWRGSAIFSSLCLPSCWEEPSTKCLHHTIDARSSFFHCL